MTGGGRASSGGLARTNHFTCPGCAEIYRLHWLAGDGSGLCSSCAGRRDGSCKWADEHPQHLDQHPCSTASEEPGTPCRYCAEAVPLDGTPCPNCWHSLDGMTTADIKAAFAADGTFSIDPEVKPS